MVAASVWQEEAGLDYKAGVAHVECLEKKIGRALVLDDFTDYPINEVGMDEALRARS